MFPASATYESMCVRVCFEYVCESVFEYVCESVFEYVCERECVCV